ncbi:glycosyltransferase [Luteimonas sp. R10]|uniref:glycosyltransferase n=1 Tax=Luteimonas sp. R10 TaxID=3108176 RepID=UPI003092F8C0|nr:glycosyltransferase [Luteimonas sp. R10]
MSKPAKISVIIPVFNDAAGAMRCLDAISTQSYPMHLIQAVLVDNESTHPVHITNTYPFTFLLKRCTTPGSYAARNVGVAMSDGDIIVFTDADCVPMSDWLSNGVKALHACAPKSIIGGDVLVSEPNPRTGTGLYQYLMGFQQQENIHQRGFSVTANLFCTRKQFLRIGNFDERLLSGGDLEWSARAKAKGFDIGFAKDSIVTTPPRTSLASAIRQARRVAAGRMHLRRIGAHWVDPSQLRHRRKPALSLLAAMRREKISLVDRMRVVTAAAAIKAASIAEIAYLYFGGSAERR